MISFILMTLRTTLQNCISVSDLKKGANAILKDLKEPKVVFVNNKPTAVIVKAEDFEAREVIFDPPITPKQFLTEYKNAYGKRVSKKSIQKPIQK